MPERKLNSEIQALVVDDSNIMRAIITSHLKKIGVVNVKEAFDGKKALSILEEHEGKMDLIISDWNMPGMQGIDLLRAVRSHEKYKDVAFLMVTAEKTMAHVVLAVKEGANEFLPKPFTAEMLELKIRKIFPDII
jgi:two-component system chemotaxis response regulator CheY